MAKKVVSGWELFVGPFPNLWSFFLQSIVIPEFWELWWFNSFVNPFLINILTCSMTLSSQRLFLSLSSASVLITSGRSALFLSLQQLFSTLCFSNFYRSELVLIRSSNNSSSGRWRIALYYRKKKNSDGFKTKIHLLLWNVKTNIDDELYTSL